MERHRCAFQATKAGVIQNVLENQIPAGRPSAEGLNMNSHSWQTVVEDQ